MRIAEMEAHHEELLASDSKIAALVGNGEFPSVFSICEASFASVVPAIQFRKKRSIEPETPRLLPFTVVCKYGPPLFERDVVASLADFLESTRALAKHEDVYLQAARVALERVEVARQLWNRIEHEPGCLELDVVAHLRVSGETVGAILDVWQELGVVIRKQERESHRLELRTQLTGTAEGVCHSCGVRGQGAKELLFQPITCRKCRAEGYYHIAYARHG